MTLDEFQSSVEAQLERDALSCRVEAKDEGGTTFWLTARGRRQTGVMTWALTVDCGDFGGITNGDAVTHTGIAEGSVGTFCRFAVEMFLRGANADPSTLVLAP